MQAGQFVLVTCVPRGNEVDPGTQNQSGLPKTLFAAALLAGRLGSFRFARLGRIGVERSAV